MTYKAYVFQYFFNNERNHLCTTALEIKVPLNVEATGK